MLMHRLIGVALCLLAAFIDVGAALKHYNTKAGPVPNKLNVHLVAHTHDDVGWLKTVDQYYMGANNSIQAAGVQYILDSVLLALEANPDRRFVYVEQAFYQRWWREAEEEDRARMQALYAGGQLDFVNGGWCMHDEGAAHAVDMIDQTTTGHKYLKEQFNCTPTVGWQIDPFGHSAMQGALLSAEVGFDSLWFLRIDYQDKMKRMADKTMQFMWRPSVSLGPAAQVLSGAFITGYGPPKGFCFDQHCSDTPIQDDERLEDYNVDFMVDLFVNRSLTDAASSATPNVLFLMGSDFQHENSNDWFKNLDKLIHYVNLDGRINVFYSTPALLTQCLNDANVTWSVKTDDFFPISAFPHMYWSGYFSSRPALKRYIREASGYLQSSRQLEALTTANSSLLQHYTEVMGVVQHHDAVSGTSKQHVAYDYAARIATGVRDGKSVTNAAFSALTQMGASGPVSSFSQCEAANVSVCTPTSTLPFVFVAYNPLPRRAMEVVKVPVAQNASGLIVTDEHGNAVPFDTIPTPEYDTANGGLPYTLVVMASLPALGFTSFSVSGAPSAPVPPAPVKLEEPLTISNDYLTVTFDPSSGLLSSMTNLVSGVSISVTQEWFWYNATTCGDGWGNQDPPKQNSGAYMLRVNKTDPYPVATGPVQTKVTYTSPLVSEVSQVFAPWLTQKVRLFAGQPYAEFEWIVGSVPIDDGLGKEVISRFSSNISSGDSFFTDSNGREMQLRRLNYRPTWNVTITAPVGGNYFPVSAAAFINDTSAQLTVLTDRAEGSGSFASGQIELLVHRRLLADDSQGVGEPLNETIGITPYPNPVRIGPGLIIKGIHRVLLDTPPHAASRFRPQLDSVYYPPTVAVAEGQGQEWMHEHNTNFSALAAGADLPVNVHVFTLQSWAANTILLRLAHQFAVGEDATLSQPVSVSLTSLFSTLKITGIEEVTLTANQNVAEMRARRMKWRTAEADGTTAVHTHTPQETVTMDAPTVTLNPLQIRSFLLTVA